MSFHPAARPPLARPAIHIETLVLLAAAFVMAAGNGPFWQAALEDRVAGEPGTWLFAGAVFVAFSALYFSFVALLSGRRTVRPLLAFVIVLTAGASYYMDRYGVYMDRMMLRNVMSTNYKEARELLGWDMVEHLLVFGVLPASFLWWPRLKERPIGRALVMRAAWVGGALAVGAASMVVVFADFASLMRNHHEVRYLITPANIVASLASNAWGRVKRPNQALIAVGTDAVVGATGQARARPTLLVVVVGETARAQNFSLNGYSRDTNPQLARRNVISYPTATACVTSTEVSLPCMFSPFGRAHYDEEKILTHESVLHVLARAGVQVLWRDNQSGCKGVCAGLPIEKLDRQRVESLCAEDQCLDEILLRGMDQVLRDRRGNLLVVMHQLGSHGPSYYKRYPATFRQFTPACERDDLRLCSEREILNAYDNSLLYTDFFLGQVIDFLQKAHQTHDTAMLYVSDHGESLGEAGLYLHGMPWSIAPQVQTSVPLIIWLSPALQRGMNLDAGCVRAQSRQQRASHDNLFHSLLGFFDVQTRVYDKGLDLFAACRGGPSLAAVATKS